MLETNVNGERTITVEVAYAKPQEQFVVVLSIPVGMSVDEAVNISGLLNRFPEISRQELNVGIFGKNCKLDHILRHGERVEIYRPLLHDPKEARRQRALNQK